MAGLSEQQLMNHLLFHKALIEDDVQGGAPTGESRINDYIRMVKEAGAGNHVGIEDPFDRSISLAFELVLDHGMDPWHIDLVRFTSLYMDRVQKGAKIDLITAGKLLHMAWSILRLQSDRLREAAEPPILPDPEPSDPWDSIDASLAEEDPDRAYTQLLLATDGDIIDEKIRHKGDRKVTLLELVAALEEARREADLRASLVEKRESDKAVRNAARRGKAEGAAHKEDPDADIREVWERILGQNGVPIPITSIQEKSREDMVKTLVSVLFLARENKIRLWQENFPYGMIYVQNPDAAPHAEMSANAQN